MASHTGIQFDDALRRLLTAKRPRESEQDEKETEIPAIAPPGKKQRMDNEQQTVTEQITDAIADRMLPTEKKDEKDGKDETQLKAEEHKGIGVLTPVLAQLPPPDYNRDAFADFPETTKEKITACLKPLTWRGSSFNVVKLATHYEMLLRNPCDPYKLSDLEAMLSELQKHTGFFVWDVRMHLVARTIVVRFLRQKPEAVSALAALPGIALLQVAKPDDHDGSSGGCFKHRSQRLPLVILDLTGHNATLDAQTTVMLTAVRNRLELLCGEHTPADALAVVSRQSADSYWIQCDGHLTVQLADLRRLALVFPHHIFDVYCAAPSEQDVAIGRCTGSVAVHLASYYTPVPKPLYAPAV